MISKNPPALSARLRFYYKRYLLLIILVYLNIYGLIIKT